MRGQRKDDDGMGSLLGKRHDGEEDQSGRTPRERGERDPDPSGRLLGKRHEEEEED
jgi:hypothetical protein